MPSKPSKAGPTDHRRKSSSGKDKNQQRRESQSVKQRTPPPEPELAHVDAGRNEDGIALSKSTAMCDPLAGWPDVPLVTTRSVSYKARSRGKIFALEAMPGGRVMSGGMSSGDVEFFHPDTGAIERVLAGGHGDSVLCMATTPTGIFTSGADSHIIKWGAADLQREAVIEVEGLVTSLVYCASLGHTGLLSSTSTEGAPITQWNIETAEEVAILEGHRAGVTCMCVDDAYLYVGCSDGSIYVYEVLERILVLRVDDCHTRDIWAIHSDGSGVITTGGDDGIVKVWNYNALDHGVPVHELAGHKQAVRSVLSYEGLIFSTGNDGFVVVWDVTLETPTPIEVLFANIDPDAPDGRQRIFGGDGINSSQQLTPHTGKMTPPSVFHPAIAASGSGAFTSVRSMASLPTDSYNDKNPGGPGGHAAALSGDGFTSIEPTNHAMGDQTPEEAAAAEIDAKNRSDVLAKLKQRERTLSRRMTTLGLEGNELVAGGFDGYIIKWNVETLLPLAMEVVELPPLVGGTDAEREHFAAMDVYERHERLQRREVRRALSYYTELPINFVIDSLNVKVKGSWLSMEMMPFILFLVLFSIFVLNEYSIIDIFNMTKGVRAKIEGQSIGGFKDLRTYTDIKNLEKYDAFLFGAFVPKLWELKPVESEWFESFRFAGQNELASAVRFRTQRALNDSCSFESHRFKESAVAERGNECHDRLTGITLADQAQDPYACADPRALCSHNATQIRDLFNFTSGKFEFSDTGGAFLDALKYYGSGGYSIDIAGTVSMAEAATRLRAALDNGFIDNLATRVIIIEYFHYNAALDIFVSHKFIAEILPGGAWFMRVLHFPFAVFDAGSSTGRLVYEAFFFLFVLYWAIKFFVDAHRYYKLNGAVLGYFFDVWSMLELVNTSLFLVSFGLRWAWFVQSSKVKHLTVKPFDIREYPSDLEFVRDTFLLQVYINSVNTVLTYMKILKFVQLNDKLNILTRALALGSSNIIGVLILFVYFVFAFAMCGFVLFGPNVFEYRTPDAAYNSLLRLLVGDYDYDSLSESARGATLVFFWAYTVMSLFLLLNFLVAVLADAFNEAVAERLPIPIDDAIVRAAQTIVRSVSIRYIRITLVLIFHRSSKTSLTAEHAAGLRAFRDSLMSPEGLRCKDYDELDGAYVTKSYFIASVPEMLKTSANLNFMEEVWSDMAFEWHYRLRDASNRERHEQEELVVEVLSFELKHVAEAIVAAGRGVREMVVLSKHLKAFLPVITGEQSRPGTNARDGTIMESFMGNKSTAPAVVMPPLKIQRKAPASAGGAPSPAAVSPEGSKSHGNPIAGPRTSSSGGSPRAEESGTMPSEPPTSGRARRSIVDAPPTQAGADANIPEQTPGSPRPTGAANDIARASAPTSARDPRAPERTTASSAEEPKNIGEVDPEEL